MSPRSSYSAVNLSAIIINMACNPFNQFYKNGFYSKRKKNLIEEMQKILPVLILGAKILSIPFDSRLRRSQTSRKQSLRRLRRFGWYLQQQLTKL